MARQRGAIIRRGKTYYVKYRTPSGKQKWESGFPNRSQAQQRLNQLLGEIGHGTYVEPKAIKLKNSQKSGWGAERPSAAQLYPPTDRLFAAD